MNKEDLQIIRDYVYARYNESYKNTVYDFLIAVYKDESYTRVRTIARVLRSLLGDSCLCEFDWDFYRQAIANCEDVKQCQFNILTEFLIYLVKHNIYCGKYKRDIDIDVLNGLIHSPTRNINEKFRSPIYPWNIIRYKSYDKRYPDHYIYIFAPGTSKEISRLITEYFAVYDEVFNFRKKECYDHNYFFDFSKSLEGKFVVDTINDFNDAIFEQQLSYFHKNELLVIEKSLGVVPKFHIYVQYRLGETNAKKQYKKYSIDVLKYNTIMSDVLVNGFVISNLSVYDTPEFHPRMLLKVGGYNIQKRRI